MEEDNVFMTAEEYELEANALPPAKRVCRQEWQDDENEDSYNNVAFRETQSNKAARLTWARPARLPMDSYFDDFVFQQMDVNFTTELSGQSIVCASTQSKSPLFRLYGLTDNGNSVMLNVFNFLPYLYTPVPTSSALTNAFTPSVLCSLVKEHLHEAILERLPRNADVMNEAVISVTIVKAESLVGFHDAQKMDFFKITLALPSYSSVAKRILEEDGLVFPIIGHRPCATFESDIHFTLRFLIDTGLRGVSWLTIPKNRWHASQQPVSHCQYEIDCSYSDIIAHAPDGEWIRTASMRILSFDIECAGRENFFPDAAMDPVIQIANIIKVVNAENGEYLTRNIFVLNTCDPILGADVRCFETEVKMLTAWSEFVVACDADLFTGYNIVNFDIPYLFKRAEALGIDSFARLTRLKYGKAYIREGIFQSKAFGTRDSKEIFAHGRVPFDMMQAIQRDHKYRSFKLNSVAATVLGDQKEDVHPSMITPLFNGSASDRQRLAVYCLKDALLPLQLMDKLMTLVNYIEMARVTGVPFAWLLLKGQSIKVLSQLYRQANTEGLLVPFHEKAHNAGDGYKGATVVPPKTGFYDIPIVTLDFASLYPSIMMAHNLCYSTLTTREYCEKHLQPDEYTRTPCDKYFVKTKKREGILPRILRLLLSQRGIAKKEMAAAEEAGDVPRYMSLNARQLALKISANSVYGFTGATIGTLPCLEVSESVTGFGREMIQNVIELVEGHYTKANGYEHDAVVIYGDTDSVMIKFGPTDLVKCMGMGKEAAPFVSKLFISPIKLEFEKVYFPYLLCSKKRYAGMFWTKPDKYDKMDCKGLETVRRDNCLFVKNTIDASLKAILIDRDPAIAVAYVKSIIRQLFMNQIDIAHLIISKGLSKHEKDYKSKQAHIELNKKIEARNNGKGYSLGDRVQYVVIAGLKQDKMVDRTEDPIYVIENNLPIDKRYYLEMLRKPILRVFKAILPNAEAELFRGDHTRHIVKPTPKTGGIMAFTKSKESCLGCKTSVNDNEVVCASCEPQVAIHYTKSVQEMRTMEGEFSRLMTFCQGCQGSLHKEVICAASDCAIFYKRTKAAMDLKAAQTKVGRFNAAALDW